MSVPTRPRTNSLVLSALTFTYGLPLVLCPAGSFATVEPSTSMTSIVCPDWTIVRSDADVVPSSKLTSPVIRAPERARVDVQVRGRGPRARRRPSPPASRPPGRRLGRRRRGAGRLGVTAAGRGAAGDRDRGGQQDGEDATHPSNLTGGLSEAGSGGMCREREVVAVRVAEPRDPGAARRGPDAALVLTHAVVASELDPA